MRSFKIEFKATVTGAGVADIASYRAVEDLIIHNATVEFYLSRYPIVTFIIGEPPVKCISGVAVPSIVELTAKTDATTGLTYFPHVFSWTGSMAVKKGELITLRVRTNLTPDQIFGCLDVGIA